METFVGSMDTNAKVVRALTALIPLTLVGCLPGILAVGSMTYKRSLYRAGKFAAVGTGMTLYALFVWLATVSTGISTRALEKIGVYSTTPETFEILNMDAQEGFARIGIVPSPNYPNIVRVYDRFAFGNIRLLCESAFTPGITDESDSIFSSDRAAKRKSKEVALAAGRNCIVMSKDDVRPVSTSAQ
jgi:hypothetical protein